MQIKISKSEKILKVYRLLTKAIPIEAVQRFSTTAALK
jgi:hypothetical protein